LIVPHSIEFKPSALKGLKALSYDLRLKISKAVNVLATNPRPSGCKKLEGQNAYRIRVGDYRVVYEIHDDVLIVLVVRVAHRREVYKA
jgi:mRNA interferase RelE/StbE